MHLFLTERLRIFNPSLRVARERQAVKKPPFFFQTFLFSYCHNPNKAF
jgi:hypothetical protein